MGTSGVGWCVAGTRPAWALSALLLGVVSVVGIAQYRYAHWTPLQRFYLAPYVRSTILNELGLTTSGRYALLTVVDRRGPRVALDADVTANLRSRACGRWRPLVQPDP